MQLQPNTLLGKYRVIRLIGDGGMGSVYECQHEVLGSRAALKFLHPELARRPGLAERFLREARVSATIQNPHVARVIDVDQTPEGRPFFVMELLQGESLQSLLDRGPRLAQAQAIDFTLQILSGLTAAHALGVVHRDMKPDNVFVTASETGPLLKIIDFGIAKLKESPEFPAQLTRAGAVMGTPEYMAPEQFYAANEVDGRADIYSVGVMLYEMLGGQRPAAGSNPQAIVSQVTTGHVTPLGDLAPHLDRDLVLLVHQAMAPMREHRFATCAAMQRALSRFSGAFRPEVPQVPSAAPFESKQPRLTTAQTPVAAFSAVPKTVPPSDRHAGQERAAAPAVAAGGGGGTLPGDGPGQRSTEPVPAVSFAQIEANRAVSAAALSGYGQRPSAVLGHVSSLPAAPVFRTKPDRGSRWRWLWAIPVLLVLAGAGVFAGIWFDVLINPFEDNTPPPLPAFPVSTPPATVDRSTSVESTPVSPNPGSTPTPAVTPGRPTRPPPRPDAGTPPSPDAGFNLPPITLPTSLPPLPTSFPTTLPSGLPTIPGFPPQTTTPKDPSRSESNP